MRTIAYDPYISPDRAKQLDVELIDLDELCAQSDFVTIHLPKTKETADLFDAARLATLKPGARIVNAARGGIVNEADLAAAVASGTVAGAALDVFASEPTTDSPLFSVPQIVVTPHLGASTSEAQDKAGEQIAEQIVLALRGDFVPYAVNVQAQAASPVVRPFLMIAERLGRFLVSLEERFPNEIEIEYQGQIAEEDTGMLRLAVLKGVLSHGTEEPVSFVNAPRLVEERGLTVREVHVVASPERSSQVVVRTSNHAVGGALTADGKDSQVVLVDGHELALGVTEFLLVVRNDDRPGMIGAVATAVGVAGVSIVNMAVSQTREMGTALMVLALDRPLPDAAAAAIAAADGIIEVHRVTGV